jgi:putative PIN family toxin of toxin-antitoxin system
MPVHTAPRIVLDTNVALDWLVFQDAGAQALGRALARRSVCWLATIAMRAELAHMLAHASLARWVPDSERALASFDALATLTPAPASPGALRCQDPDDQMFIDLALAAPARWLLTRDKALLRLARRARTLGVEVTVPNLWPGTDTPP